MMKYSFCPNLSLPENQVRISEIGKENFIKEYYNTNFNIEVNNENKLAIDELFVDINLFPYRAQSQIIDSILYQLDQEIQENNTGVDTAFEYVKEAFINQLSDLKESNDDNSLDNYIELFENIISKWDKFKEFTIDKLSNIGIKISKNFENIPLKEDNTDLIEVNDNPVEEGTFTSSEATYQRDNYSDSFVFSKSSRENASGRLKYALSRIPNMELVDGKYEIVDNFMGLPTYNPLEKVWNKLLTTLSPYLENEIIPKMEELSLTDPIISEVLNKIKSDSSGTMVNEFVVTFSKQQANHTTVLLKTDINNSIEGRVIETNRQSADRVLISEWSSNLINSPLINETGGEYYIDTNKAEELLKIIEDINKKESNKKELFNKFFNYIGVTLSNQTLDNISNKGVTINGELVDPKTFANRNLKLIADRFAGKLEDNSNEANEEEVGSLLDNNNAYISESSSFADIARAELEVNPFIYESSFINGEGNSKYSYVNNSYLSKLFKKLKSSKGQDLLNDLILTPYAKHSLWVNKLLNDNSFKDNFKLSYLDTIRDSSKASNTGVQFKGMNTKEKELTRLLLFMNQGRDNNKVASFIPLIPSDKTTIPVIQANKINVQYNEYGEFNRETKRELLNIFIAEYNRIKDVLEQNKTLSSNDKIANYHGDKGQKFMIYDFFNDNPLVFNEDGSLKELDRNDLIENIFPLINDFIDTISFNQLNAWKEVGIDVTKQGDRNYLNNLKELTNEQLEDYISFDYTINNFIASVNYTQLIGGDPAQLGKRSISGTWENYSKRTAKDIAPGTDGNFEDPSYRMIIVKDPQVNSVHLEEYGNILKGDKLSPYKNMQIADAQELTTLDEHLKVLRAFGKYTPAVRDAGQRLKEGGNDIKDILTVLDPEGNFNLGPMKPVQVGRMIDKVNRIDRMYYVKTSSFPLIPALTKGLELDKVRLFMENATDENGNKSPIDRLVFQTGVKIGNSQNAQSLFKDNGEFNNEIKNNSIILDRDLFRIQQEVPYDSKETMTNEGSQGRKLILGDISNNTEVSFKGEIKTAKELKNYFDGLHIRKSNLAMDSLLKEIGAEIINGDIIIPDISKLQKTLIKEAKDRNFNINDIYGLQLIKDENGENSFTIPLAYQHNSDKLESIINALVTNRVIKSELPGFSAVQGTKAGFSRVGTIEDLEQSQKSDIIWLDKNDTELRYIRKSKDGKSLLPAEILVPSWFRDKKGNLIDIKDFVDSKGNLDTSKIDPELLNIFGIRIPTQGYNSMMSFKVKGFIPNYMGSLAIVPGEVVAQMGSDFDVDKLFIYRKEFKIQNNTFKTLDYSRDFNDLNLLNTREINDAIVDFYIERYKDPSLLEKILEPNGFGQLPELSDRIAEIMNLKGDNHFLTPLAQNDVHKANNDGKAGVGIFSLFSVFTRYAQDFNMSMRNLDVSVTDNNTTTVYNKLADTTLEQSPTITIQYFQSAAVDNANEQILGNLNINAHNMDVVGTLALFGVKEDVISYFTANPVIRDIVNRLENMSDVTSTEFIQNPLRKVYFDISKEKTDLTDSEISDNYNSLNLESNTVNLNKQNLISNLTEDINNQDYMKILDDYIILKKAATDIRSLQRLAGLDTSGAGQRYANLESTVEAVNDILTNISMENNPILGTEGFISSGIPGNNIRILRSLKSIYSNLVPYTSIPYKTVVEDIRNMSGKINSPISSDQISKIYNFLKSYVYSSPNLVTGESTLMGRLSLLFNYKGNKSLGNRLDEYFKTKEGKRSLLKERIKIEYGKTVFDPILVKAVNSPGASITDNNNVISEIYDMYMRGNETQRELVQDMAKYFILTGGHMTPISIGKFIPYDILNEYDLSNKLRDIDKSFINNTYTNLLQNSSIQYFQTFPSEAVPITDAFNPIYQDEGNTLIFKDPINSFYVDQKINGSNILAAPQVMSIYQKEDRKFKLYLLSSTVDNDHTYTAIPTVNHRYIRELDTSLEIAKTAMKDQKVPIKTISSPIKEDKNKGITNTIEESNLTSENQDQIKQNFINKYENLNMEELLNAVENLNITEGNKRILNDLKPLILNSDIEYNTFQHINALGSYSNGIVNLNIERIAERNNRDEILVENLLHESLHGLTVKYLNTFESKSNNLLTDKEVENIKNIYRLYNKYKNEVVSKEDFNKFKEINDKLIHEENVSPEEIQFYSSNKGKLYPLLNVREFVAAGLTNQEFVNTLKSNNLWTSFIEFISNLLGLNKNLKTDYDFLYKVVGDLIGNNNVNTEVNNNIGIEVQEGVYIKEKAASKEEQLDLFNDISDIITEQAFKTNKSKSANKMIGLGLRWDYKSNNIGINKIFKNKPDNLPVDVGTTIAGRSTSYGYFNKSINGEPLHPLTKEFLDKITKITGYDVSNYDAALINIYDENTFIGNHSDIDESITAINYPVVVLNIGGDGNITLNKNNYNLPSGSSYLFGLNGKNRTIPHSTRVGNSNGFLPNINTNLDNETFRSGKYRITITLRRVMPLDNIGTSDYNLQPPTSSQTEFANQRSEFLRAHKTSIGKRISENTLNKFKKSQENNPKYNMLEIKSWNGELRISNRFPLDGYYNIDPESIVKLTPEEKAAKKALDRLYNIRNKFMSNERSSSNPIIKQKIDTLNTQIEELKEKGTIDLIMSQAVIKLDEIQDKLREDSTLNAFDIEEIKRFLGFYRDLDQIIIFDSEFTEDIENLNFIINKSKELLDLLNTRKLNVVVDYLNSTLDTNVNIATALSSPLKDTSNLETTFQSGAMSSSQAVQLVQAAIERSQIAAHMEFTNYRDTFKGLIEAYVKKYGGDYSQLLQKDDKGNPTGYLLNEYSQDYYDILKSLKDNKKKYNKFRRENTTIEITEENNKKWLEDVESVRANNPLWETKGTVDNYNYETFVFRNSPKLYKMRYEAGKSTSSVRGALKYISITPIDKWKSKDFTKLMSKGDKDPAVALFNLAREEFEAMNRKYGNQSNFIPEFAKGFLDTFLKGDVKGGFDKLGKDITNSVYKTIHPNNTSSQLDLDGTPFNVIPVMHMSDTLNPKDKDYNIAKVLLLSKQQEIMNKHKFAVEPYLVAMKDIISELPQQVINNQTGEILLDGDNNPILDYSNSRNSNINKQVSYMLDDYLYGKGKEDSGAIKKATRTIKTVNSKGETVETIQVVTGSAIGDTINNITRAKGMMLNAFSGVANILWGIVSNTMLAANRIYFNESQALRAFGVMLNASNPSSDTNKKVGKLMDKFHMMKSRSDLQFGRLGVNTTGSIIGENDAYFMQEYGERFVQGQTTIAILMNKQVKALDGTKHSIFDAHDELGNWNVSKFGEDIFLDPKNRLKIVSEVSSAVGDAHGDYDRSLMIKKNVLGRMLMVFRTWIPQSLAVRFGQEYQDLQGVTRKGRYRSLNTKHLLLYPLIQDIYSAYKTSSDEDTVDTRNLRAIGLEAALAATLYSVGFLMKGLMDDLDPEDKELFYVMLNSTTRLQGDLTFYFNPYSFQSTIREPAPAFKTVMDFIDLGPAVANWINDEDEYKSGHRKGRSKLWFNIRKQFPIVSQPDKIMNVANMALD